jgi:hypothetical protein
VDFALLHALVFYLDLVLCDTFDTSGTLIKLHSENDMRLNAGRILERWEWRAMEVKDTAWYNQ